ncbi:unnamed protein product [Orchesella dallaii]|uniref:Uncharacterized protein n=1 Tax=Orchesella dallaii TaxID=48710 RepID=A0ABP1Q0Q1_9HEXA
MNGSRDQVWVSSVLKDEDVPDVLTLCFSLRRVMTSYKIAAIVSPKVSKGLRDALRHGFDYVFVLEEDMNTAELEIGNFAKLFAFTLKSFDKIVMLSPTMLVVQNCDELFDIAEDNDQPLFLTEAGSTSILLVRPSLSVFKELLDGIPKRNGDGVEGFLKKWIANQISNYKTIDEKYNQTGNLLYVFI